MTSINIISDLHLVFKSRFNPTLLKPADVLIVAGDLSTAQCYIEHEQYIRKSTEGMFKQYIFIKGNHDYYHCLPHELPTSSAVYDRNFIIPVRNIDFICSTLWTPVMNHPHPWCIKFEINDYEYIKKFTPEACNSLFYSNLDWIRRKVNDCRFTGQTPVVVTHHAPLYDLVDECRKGDPSNALFCNTNPLSQQLVRDLNTPLWIYGHMHTHSDTVIEGTRYIRNPFGITLDVPSTINFQYDCVVEL